MICTIMTIVASQGRGWFLLPIVYSFAMINLALASLLPGEFITHLEASPEIFIHIGLALFAYATLIIAALYALQLAWLDYQLKHKKLTFNADMPPLMSIERKMFHITQIGVVLLTLTLCTGLLYMDNLFSKENVHKAVLSIMAWFVYIVLLWGHYHEGWRGRRVIWFSFAGAFYLHWLILVAVWSRKLWFASDYRNHLHKAQRNWLRPHHDKEYCVGARIN